MAGLLRKVKAAEGPMACCRSVLVTYPEEGHGVRKWPAAIDYTACVVGWFEEYLI